MVRPAGERFPARIQRGPDPSNQIDEHVSTEIVAISLQFFVQLYSYKVQTESVERQAALVMGGAGGGGEGGGALPWLRTQTRRCADEADVDAADAGCVFDAIVDLLKRMQDDLLKKVVDAVMLEVKAKSQPYRLDKCVSAEFFLFVFVFTEFFFRLDRQVGVAAERRRVPATEFVADRFVDAAGRGAGPAVDAGLAGLVPVPRGLATARCSAQRRDWPPVSFLPPHSSLSPYLSRVVKVRVGLGLG